MAQGYTRQDVADEISDGSVIDAVPLDAEFNGLDAAFAVTTGHAHDGTAGNGGPITKIGPVQDVNISASAMSPKTNSAMSLGTSSFKWNNVFADTLSVTTLTATLQSVADEFRASSIGAVSDPSFTFVDDQTTGLYLSSTGVLGITANNTAIATISSGGLNVSKGDISLTGTGSKFSGNGSGLTTLNASNLAVGTVPNARVAGSYTGITGVGTLVAGSIGSGFGNINIGSNVFTGIGSGLTSLNASNITTGTVPNGRISGAYTGFTSITVSGVITTNEVQADDGGAADPSFTFASDQLTGFYKSGTNQTSYSAGGTQIIIMGTSGLVVNGNITSNGGVFSGSGSSLTTLNASNLSSGTVPNARISGSYSNFSSITATGIIDGNEFQGDDGAAADPSFTFRSEQNTGLYLQGAGSLGVTLAGTPSARFTSGGLNLLVGSYVGDGSNITALNATQLTSGTIPSARFGTTTADNNWVGARLYSTSTSGNSGDLAFATASGTTGYNRGDTIAGTSLTVASANDTGSTTLTGTWKCLGYVKTSGNPQERATMWIRQ